MVWSVCLSVCLRLLISPLRDFRIQASPRFALLLSSEFGLMFCDESQRQLLPPAGTSLGKWTGCRAAVRGGRVMGWGSSLGRAPKGDQEPAGGATGDGSRCCWGWVLAGCTPGRTLIGLRLPDRGKNPTPGPACERCARLLNPASPCGPDVEFNRGPTGSGSLLNFTSGPARRGHSIDQRSAGPAGSRI